MSRERRVRSGGLWLRATEHGEGPPFVLAHGVGSSARFLTDAFAGPLAAAGFRLVAYDLRGHGGSSPVADAAGHRLEHHVADLHRVVEAVGARFVGGVSLGGHAAVAYAVAAGGDRLDGVVACLPAWTGRAVPGEGPHAAVAAAACDPGIAALIAGFARDRALPGWLREVLVRDWAAHDRASLAAALRALDGGVAPTAADLSDLTVPLGIVAWPDDPAHPLAVARDWAAWAPRAALEVIAIERLEGDLAVLGRAAVAALSAAAGQDRRGGP